MLAQGFFLASPVNKGRGEGGGGELQKAPILVFKAGEFSPHCGLGVL